MRMAMILLLCCHQAQTNATSAFLHRVWGLCNSTASKINPIAFSVRGGGTLQDVYNGKSEKVVSLLKWADSNGVVFAPTVQIRHDNENDMLGVYWKPGSTREADKTFTTSETNKDGHRQITLVVAAPKATRLMTIPNRLVLSSALIEDSLRRRVEDYFQQEFADKSSDIRQVLIDRFCLALVVWNERNKGPNGFWHAYFESLPETFSCSIYWDDVEREYASRIGLKGLMKENDELFDMFRKALTHLFPNDSLDSDLSKWAFVVAGTRAWKTEMTMESGETVDVRSLVPLGDLFNHRAVGGLGAYPKQDSVTSPVIMQVYVEGKVDDETKDEEIFLDYGISENPARFPVIYGFVDASSPTFPLMWIIRGALKRAGTEDGAAMGFNNFEQIAVDTETGSPSPLLWDAYLYMIQFDDLRRSPEGSSEAKLKQDLLQIVERSCRERNRSNAMQDWHLKWLPKMIEFLILDVGDQINALGPLPEDLTDEDHPNYNMIRSFHEYQLTVLEKVKRFLESQQEST